METQSEVSARQQALFEQVRAILLDLTQDWDLELVGGIRRETRLVADLAFESIDMVQFIVALGDEFGRGDLPFELLLMDDGRYVDDVAVSQVVDFLDVHLVQPR